MTQLEMLSVCGRGSRGRRALRPGWLWMVGATLVALLPGGLAARADFDSEGSGWTVAPGAGISLECGGFFHTGVSISPSYARYGTGAFADADPPAPLPGFIWSSKSCGARTVTGTEYFLAVPGPGVLMIRGWSVVAGLNHGIAGGHPPFSRVTASAGGYALLVKGALPVRVVADWASQIDLPAGAADSQERGTVVRLELPEGNWGLRITDTTGVGAKATRTETEGGPASARASGGWSVTFLQGEREVEPAAEDDDDPPPPFPGRVVVTPLGRRIAAMLLPAPGLALADVALAAGYDRFNWYQVELTTPFVDPPAGGGDEFGGVADSLPFYWDDVGPRGTGYHVLDNTGVDALAFEDEPGDPQLGPGQHHEYLTVLAGVRPDGTWDALFPFRWSSDNTGSVGGLRALRNIHPTSGGDGGVFGVATAIAWSEVPLEIRRMLAADGARNVPVEPDVPPPTADAGPDQRVECAGSVTAVLMDGTASAGPAGSALSYEWREGGVLLGTGATPQVELAFGVHDINLTVTDTRGRTASDVVRVEVVDTTPPEIVVEGCPAVLWPPNHKLVRITPSVAVHDRCDPAPCVSLTAVSSELDQERGRSNKEIDVIVHSPSDLELRAERSGRGDGRVYTLTWTAWDRHGNVATVVRTVTVLKSLGRSELPPPGRRDPK